MTQTPRRAKWAIFLAATALVVYLCAVILRPFVNIIAWAIVLAITFIAIYRQLRGQREQARHNTQLLRSQAHYNALILGHRPWEMLIDNEDLARIFTSGTRGRMIPPRR